MNVTKALIIGFAFGVGTLAGGTAVFAPRNADAQVAPTGGAAIAQGPGGVWVVHQNRVYVCAIIDPQVGTQPPTPTCGKPRSLP